MKNEFLTHTQLLLNKEVFTRKEIIDFVVQNRLIDDEKVQYVQITELLYHIITIDYMESQDTNKSTIEYLTHNKKWITQKIKYNI